MEGPVDVVVLRLDADDRITSWPETAARLYGLADDDVRGDPFARLYDAPHEAHADLAKARADGHFESVVRHRRADGDGFDVEQVLASIDDTVVAVLRTSTAAPAIHDRLTGVPDRDLLLDRLQHALARYDRDDATVAVLCLGLDRFKLVNEAQGHRRGDALLVRVARRLRDIVRTGDTVGRLGGDQFVVLLEGITGEREAEVLCRRILHRLDHSVDLDGSEIHVTASAGVVVAAPGQSAERVLADAEAAMHQAKSRGTGRLETFHPTFRSAAEARFATEHDLRRAIDGEQLRLHYQPIVDLSDNSIIGAEALVRWVHPERGMVSPVEFISVAEETDLILRIGEWTLDEGCRQLREWEDTVPALDRFTLSVNLSAQQLLREDMLDVVAEVMGGHRIQRGAPVSLALEVTESTLMDDVEFFLEALLGLKALGPRLYIDDFGTGYSSLAYLRRFPVDTLKIDRSFVDGLGVIRHDSEIARAIVFLARALDLRVIAEGVETMWQLEGLRALGCDAAQGYLFSKPVPADEFTGLLRRPGKSLPARPAPS